MSPRLGVLLNGRRVRRSTVGWLDLRESWASAVCAVVIALVAMLLPSAAGTVLGTTSVAPAGSVPIGGISATTATFTFIENDAAALPASPGGTLVVGITDSAGNSTVHFVGTPSLTAPIELGATISLDSTGDFFTITTTDEYALVVEQLTVSDLALSADPTAAPGPIIATLGGSESDAVAATFTTATGLLAASYVAGATTLQVGVSSTCPFVNTASAPAAGTLNFGSQPEAVSVITASPLNGGQQTLEVSATTQTHLAGETVTQTVPSCTPDALPSPGTVVAPTYSIAGALTDPSGAQLAGIRAVACPPTGWPCSWTDSATDGTYSISGLAAGSYQVSFGDPIHHVYATGYYDKNSATGFALDPADATWVGLPSSATGINVVLPVSYAIAGYVTTSDGTGLPGVGVGACSPTLPTSCFYTTSGDGGWYSISVDPGQYQVAFTAPDLSYASGFYVPGFVGNLAIDAQLEWGHDVHVGDAINPDGASLLNVALPASHAITGKVTDTSANPLSGILVYACQQQVSPPVGDCGGVHQGSLSAVTGPSGVFSISAADGSSYVVEFSDTAATAAYASGFYDAASTIPLGYAATLPGATPIPVSGKDFGPITVALPSVGETPAGTNVVVTPVSTGGTGPVVPVDLTFATVRGDGNTTLTTSTTPPPELPAGYQLGSSAIYYDLTTTADYTGNIAVCVSYAGVNPVPTTLLHFENGTWTDITVRPVDTADQLICGTTPSLSPFATLTTVPLTITASSGTMVRGGTVPTITPSYSGFATGDGAASLTPPPTCSTTATATSPVGTYPSSCSGAVDPNYVIAYVAGTVSVTKPVPVLAYTGPTTATPGAWTTLSATLRTATGAGMSGKTIAFAFNGLSLLATTNGFGVASVTTRAPTTAGSYPITVVFSGDTTYAATSASTTLTVPRPVPVLTYSGPTNAAPGASVTLSASLHTGGLTAIAGKTVTFSLNGASLNAVTNGLGIASVRTTAPATTKTYPVTVTFAGDANYAAAFTSASLRISKPVPVLTYAGSTRAGPGASITLSATLRTTGGAAIAGRTLTFTLHGVILTATTNGAGLASVQTKAPARNGAYPIGVTFAGDTTYAAASTSASLLVR